MLTGRMTVFFAFVVLGMLAGFGCSGDAAQEMKVESEKNRQELAHLSQQLTERNAAADAQTAKLEELSIQVARLTDRLNRVENAIADLRKQPAATAAPAPAAGLDEARVRELVGEEMRAAFDRFRQGGGNNQGDRGNRAPNDNADRAAVMLQQLGLDEAKTAQVSRILAEMDEATRAIWQDNQGGDREKNRAMMQEVRTKYEEQLAQILTAEELAKFKELANQRGGGRPRGGHDNAGGNDNPRNELQPIAPPEGGEANPGGGAIF